MQGDIQKKFSELKDDALLLAQGVAFKLICLKNGVNLNEYNYTEFHQSAYLHLAKKYGVPVLKDGGCSAFSQLYDKYFIHSDNPIREMQEDILSNSNDFFKRLFIRFTQQSNIIQDRRSVSPDSIFGHNIDYETLIRSFGRLHPVNHLGISFKFKHKAGSHVVSMAVKGKAQDARFTLFDSNIGEFRNITNNQLVKLLITMRECYEFFVDDIVSWELQSMSNLQDPNKIYMLDEVTKDKNTDNNIVYLKKIKEHDDMIEYCIDHLDCDVNEHDFNNRSAFEYVIMRHNLVLADKFIIKGFDLKNQNAISLFYPIAQTGDIQALHCMMNLYTKHAIPIPFKDIYAACCNSLDYVTGCTNQAKIVEHLFQNKLISPNNAHGRKSYFAYTLQFSALELITLCLKYGADKDICPISGTRTLCHAIWNDQSLKALFEAGCDPRVIYQGQTLHQFAISQRSLGCAKVIEQEIKKF